MTKIHSLHIKHFRGIELFSQTFDSKNCVVLIGRGDSGKTTLLHAIYKVLSPVWNTTFTDYDFFQRNTDIPIVIETVITEVPDVLLKVNKYGKYIQVLNENGILESNMLAQDPPQGKVALKVRLTVDDMLEPKWEIVSDRDNGNIIFSTADRAKLNVFMISDYVDNHFSYGKGSPLYSSLKKSLEKNQLKDPDKELMNLVRDSYNTIKDNSKLQQFESVTETIKNQAAALGLTIENLKTLLEYKAYTDSSLSLHDNDIPYHYHGKGSKRLLSMAIQYSLAEKDGIILIDEIEQGLEADRARNLARIFAKNGNGQVFITTHSRDVVLEPSCDQVFIMKKGAASLLAIPKELQGTLRAKPEAFFAKRVISCEGATEEGVIRAISDHLRNQRDYGIEVQGIVHIDGGGNNKFYKYAIHFKSIGIDSMVFCDDDNLEVRKDQDEAISKEIKVVKCDNGKAIEQQIFSDLPWEGVCNLVTYAVENNDKVLPVDGFPDVPDVESLRQLASERQAGMRTALGSAAKSKKAWFKSIRHGEELGRVWINYYDKLESNSTLKREYDEIITWIGDDIG